MRIRKKEKRNVCGVCCGVGGVVAFLRSWNHEYGTKKSRGG